MEIDAFDAARDLVKGDIVEALKTSSANRFDSVVWYQKVLLPAHEQVFLLHPVFGHYI